MVTEKTAARVPPYVSYRTLKTFIEDLKAHGIPTRIDRSVWGAKFSGSVGAQLMSALRFLQLIDGSDAPQDELKTLVDRFNTDKWASAVQPILQSSYKPIMGLSLEQISPAQLADEFKKAYTAQDAVIQKSITFFLHAAQDAGIPLSKRVLKATRRNLGRPRTAASSKKRDDNGQVLPAGRKGDNGAPVEKSKMEVLLDILDPEKMENEEQQAVWTLIRYLKKRAG